MLAFVSFPRVWKGCAKGVNFGARWHLLTSLWPPSPGLGRHLSCPRPRPSAGCTRVTTLSPGKSRDYKSLYPNDAPVNDIKKIVVTRDKTPGFGGPAPARSRSCPGEFPSGQKRPLTIAHHIANNEPDASRRITPGGPAFYGAIVRNYGMLDRSGFPWGMPGKRVKRTWWTHKKDP